MHPRYNILNAKLRNRRWGFSIKSTGYSGKTTNRYRGNPTYFYKL